MDSVHLNGPAPAGWGEAWFTEDRRYRWRLRRTWGQRVMGEGEGPLMVFVMLNPSDATARHDDATLRRCVGYAKREACSGVEVVNLSPKVAHRPAVMLDDLAAGWLTDAAQPPWWDHNMTMIVESVTGQTCTRLPPPLVVLAWGTLGSHRLVAPLAERVRDRLALECITGHALGFTRDGEPVHPLYQPASAQLVPVPHVAVW